MKNLGLIILSLFFCLGVALSIPTAAYAAGSNLTVSNTDGVMYLTTETTTTISTSSSSVATDDGNVVGRNLTPIHPSTGFAPDFGTVANFILRVTIVVAVILVFFNLVMGGIAWITSGGEKGKTEAARNRIVAAIVGLIILASSYAILTLVIRFLGFNDINSAINGVGTINNPSSPLPMSTPTPSATTSSSLRELLTK